MRMIRGIYLNGFSDDISSGLAIRQRVYSEAFGEDAGPDEDDKNAVHILLYDEKDEASGYVRLMFDPAGDFRFGYLSVLPEKRNDGLADFIMHMMFDKASMSGAKRVVSDETGHNPEYFDRYGFEREGERLVLDLNSYYSQHRCSGC